MKAKSTHGRSKTIGAKNEIAYRDLKQFNARLLDLSTEVVRYFSQCKSLLDQQDLGQDYKLLRNGQSLSLFLCDDFVLYAEAKEYRQRVLDLPPTSFSAGLLKDTIRGTRISVDHVVCPVSLPDLHDTIAHSVFEEELPKGSSPITHALYKCWPMRCRTRRFPQVVTALCKKNTYLEPLLNRFVLCSLLGNYPTANNRPNDARRQLLYSMFDYGHRETYAAAAPWRQKLFGDENCQRLWIHAVQEYMCWSICTNDVLRQLVGAVMPFEEFCKTVTRVNDKIRATFIAAATEFETAKFQECLAATISDARQGILKSSYQKTVPPFLQWIKELRSTTAPNAKLWFERCFDPQKYRLVTYSCGKYTKPSIALSSTDPDAETQEMDHDQPPVIQQQQPEEAEKDKRIEVVVTTSHITVEHSRQLERLISFFDANVCTDDQILSRFIEAMVPAFGCSPRAAAQLDNMRYEYKLFNAAKERWREKIAKFAQAHPYAYCLLEATRELADRHCAIQSCPLPRNVAYAQAQAVARRWQQQQQQQREGEGKQEEKKEERPSVNREQSFLWFCHCCREIKSLVQDHASPYRQTYVDGLRGVDTDIDTQQAYCSRSNVNLHHKCGERPLLAIPLLGQYVNIDGAGYMLCSHGAEPMRVDPEHTMFDSKFDACCKCTLEIQASQRTEIRKQFPELFGTEKYNCFLCSKKLSKSTFYYMAADTFVCKKHGRWINELAGAIEAKLTPEECEFTMPPDKARAVLVAKYKDMKAANSDRDKAFNNKLLKKIRAANVAKRGGHS